MLSQNLDSGPAQLAELKIAVKKMNEIYERIQVLTSRRQKSYFSTFSFDEDRSKAGIESRVQNFGKALTAFIKLRWRIHKAMAAFRANLKNLQDAEDVGEISTLAGLTLLTDHREYISADTRLMRYYEEELAPAMPEILNVMTLAGKVNEIGRWMAELTDFDPKTSEDDFMRMITAIRDRNIKRFNELSKRLEKRIESAETRVREEGL